VLVCRDEVELAEAGAEVPGENYVPRAHEVLGCELFAATPEGAARID
jgi:hypothetical protein